LNGSSVESVIDRDLTLQDLDNINELENLRIGKYNDQSCSKSFDKNDYANQENMFQQEHDRQTKQNYNFGESIARRAEAMAAIETDDITVATATFISSTNKFLVDRPEIEADSEQDQSSPIFTDTQLATANNPEQDQSSPISIDDQSDNTNNPEQDQSPQEQPDDVFLADSGIPADGVSPADGDVPADGVR
jgi:hypothetical protein